MKTFRLTKLLCVFPVLAVASIAGVAIGVPSTVEEFAPLQSSTSECLSCGRMQTIERRWMQNPTSSIHAGADSLWMQPHVDSEHDHWWVECSSAERRDWFDNVMFGCGGCTLGVWTMHQLAISKGDQFAQPFVQKYLLLTETGDLKSVREFVQEEILPALQEPPIQEPVGE